MLKLVIGLSNASTAKGIGFHDIGSGSQVFFVDGLNEIGTSQAQEIVISLQIVFMVFKLFASEIFFLQGMTLNHGSHGSV